MKSRFSLFNKHFLIFWIFLCSGIFPLAIIPGYIINLLIHGEFGYNMAETGPFHLQTLEYCIWAAILGAIVSFSQWLLLRKYFKISSLWILACIGGLVLSELLSGIFLAQIGINRANLGPAQGGSILAEALIFLFSGLFMGLFQVPIIWKHFHKAGFWIIANGIGWALIPVGLLIFGGILLGIVTGIFLVFIMHPKDLS